MDYSKQNNEPNQITIQVNKLMYYQKPALGAVRQDITTQENLPVQLIFPNGNFGLGIPINTSSNDSGLRGSQDIGVLFSLPETDIRDHNYRKGTVIIFLALFLVNLVITCLMYANASVVDLSKVEKYQGIAFIFGEVPQTRTSTQNANFAFTIIILLIGAMGAALENPTLISTFCYALLVNFILGIQSIPYYVYSFRYILDAFLIYVGLVLRLKCNAQFLPIHIHGH